MWHACVLLFALATAGGPPSQPAPLAGEAPPGLHCRPAHQAPWPSAPRRCGSAGQLPGRASR